MHLDHRHFAGRPSAYAYRFGSELTGGMAQLKAEIAARREWSFLDHVNATQKNPARGDRTQNKQEDVAFPTKGIDGFRRFDALGPVLQCPPSLLQVFGAVGTSGEKRMCGVEVPAAGSTAQCTVISVGSHNEYSFELDVQKKLPHCAIRTLDCTVEAQVPQLLAAHPSGFTFHPICLAAVDEVRHGRRFVRWATFMESIGLDRPPTILKIVSVHAWTSREGCSTRVKHVHSCALNFTCKKRTCCVLSHTWA